LRLLCNTHEDIEEADNFDIKNFSPWIQENYCLDFIFLSCHLDDCWSSHMMSWQNNLLNIYLRLSWEIQNVFGKISLAHLRDKSINLFFSLGYLFIPIFILFSLFHIYKGLWFFKLLMGTIELNHFAILKLCIATWFIQMIDEENNESMTGIILCHRLIMMPWFHKSMTEYQWR